MTTNQNSVDTQESTLIKTGKRALIKFKDATDIIHECLVLEQSDSGRYIKLQLLNHESDWYLVTDIILVEFLPDKGGD